MGAIIADGQAVATIVNDDATLPSIYVADIRFESKRGNKDWRAVIEVRSETDDSPVAGVSLAVDFAGTTHTLITDSDGIARTSWNRNLASGDYHTNVYDIVLAGFDWSPFVFDLEDDSDGDGKPDDVLVI